ncbi:hypothetical protein BD626DRAFT_276966 [Schizophyllum amplum]|uniref:Uncharacterized protein n=1 Tax=Schizophyllum amplum TaxID=97359 RepID=A0A550BTE8_9AGAR|nr:hypothetical protein BD626DRAFT_276966 [Auriculariopsis ampla]
MVPFSSRAIALVTTTLTLPPRGRASGSLSSRDLRTSRVLRLVHEQGCCKGAQELHQLTAVVPSTVCEDRLCVRVLESTARLTRNARIFSRSTCEDSPSTRSRGPTTHGTYHSLSTHNAHVASQYSTMQYNAT